MKDENDDYFDEEEQERQLEEGHSWDGLVNAWEMAGFDEE